MVARIAHITPSGEGKVDGTINGVELVSALFFILDFLVNIRACPRLRILFRRLVAGPAPGV